MDDRKGVATGRSKGFEVYGTLGVLVRAGERSLIDLAEAFRRLRETNFRYRPETLAALLAQYGKKW